MRISANHEIQCLGLVLLFSVAGTPLFAQGYLSAVESNKKVVFDYYRLIVEPRNPDLIEVYFADNFVDHDAPDETGTKSIVRALKAMAPAISDEVRPTLRNPPAYIMAEGDLVTWLFRQNAPDPSDKSKTLERFSLEVYRIKDRKIIEHWKGMANPQ